MGAFTIEPAEILPHACHHGASAPCAHGMDGRALLITGAFGIACSCDLETETIATSSMETLTLFILEAFWVSCSWDRETTIIAARCVRLGAIGIESAEIEAWSRDSDATEIGTLAVCGTG